MQELHLLFLKSPAVSLTQSPALNPATLPAVSTQTAVKHSCPKVFKGPHSTSGETQISLSNPDLTLFVDGSMCLDPQEH